jgi:hypothetical protein
MTTTTHAFEGLLPTDGLHRPVIGYSRVLWGVGLLLVVISAVSVDVANGVLSATSWGRSACSSRRPF